MAVLHEYVSSSDKEGYYIYDAYDGVNVTYQVSSLARRIINRLNSCDVDEQLPREVFYTLHRLELIYTHHSGVEQPEELAEMPNNGSSNSLSTSERRTFFTELLSSNDLETKERREVQEYVNETGLETKFGLDLHRNWVPSPPDDDTHHGKVKKTFQDGDWGFISSEEVDIGEDIFFHIDELDGMILLPGMSVNFTYDKTTEGYQAFHVRRLTDAFGSELEEESESQESDQDTPRDGEHVGIGGLSVGDYVEAQIDRRKGQKGLGRKGYLHIHHRKESGDDYLHISTRDDPIPVKKWVVVQITAIHDGYAEATVKSSPSNIEPPFYFP